MEKLTGNLWVDLDAFKKIFFYPKNKDFIIRPLHIKAFDLDAVIIYVQGTACINTITDDIIKPLMNDSASDIDGDVAAYIIKRITTTKNAEKISSISDMTTSLVKGDTVLLIEGSTEAIYISTSEFEHRQVEKPETENVVKGPKESFIESAQVNRSLIRKHYKYANLISEGIEVGLKSKNDVYMMYIEGIADPDLVENVRKRIKSIEVDLVLNISILHQLIEERSYSLIPSILYTERPDRAASFLNEGHIVLIMDGSPAALVLPITFWSLLHTSEDQYLRWPYGNFIRISRFIALILTLLTPAIHVAIANYHIEMIPTDLAIAISGTRETLPFPLIVEVIFMELSFELIREAGIRAPNTMGSTIGIVGALILGQAAVEANIISPILVIIVSITGLASFAISDISLSYATRLLRFAFVLAAGFLGFLGISLSLSAFLAYLISLSSFGVPFMSPLAPYYKSSNDTYIRTPSWKQLLRPSNITKLEPLIRKTKGKE